MTSNDVLVLMRQAPNHIQKQMKQSVIDGRVIWFVEDESGKGKVCVFRCDCGGTHEGVADAASAELCNFFGVPEGELWLGYADHVQVEPNMGQRLARHERG